MASQDQIKKFEEDGFVVIEDFLTNEEIASLRDECRDLVEKMDPKEHMNIFYNAEKQVQHRNDYFVNSGDKIAYFFEEKAFNDKGELVFDKHDALNKIGHALHVFCPNFKKVTFSDKVKSLCRSLGMELPILPQSMYIFKPPKIGGNVVPHQDASYLYTTPDMKLVGVWIALEDVTEENACLRFIPGSHRDGLRGNFRMIRNPDHEAFSTCLHIGDSFPYDVDKFVPVPIKKGDAILIHGLVAHRSEPNLSDKSRHIYTFHIYDEKAGKWDKQNWFQPTEKNTFVPVYEQ